MYFFLSLSHTHNTHIRPQDYLFTVCNNEYLKVGAVCSNKLQHRVAANVPHHQCCQPKRVQTIATCCTCDVHEGVGGEVGVVEEVCSKEAYI